MKIAVFSVVDVDRSGAVRLMSLAKNWVKQGHEVDFISFAWQRGKGSEKKQDFVVDGVNVKYLKAPRTPLHFHTAMITAGKILSMEKDADVFYTGKSAPLLFPVLLAKKIGKKPWVVDVDDWDSVGGFSSMPGVSSRNRILITSFEERYIPRADAVIVASKLLERRILDMGVAQEKIFYVPNGASLDEMNPKIGDNGLRKKWGLEKDKVVLYLGTLPKNLDSIKILIKSMTGLKGKLKLLSVGFGPGLEDYRELASSQGLDGHVIFTDKVPREDIKHYLALADYCALPYSDKYPHVLINRGRCSVKLYEYMAMQKPIIASDLGEITIALEGGAGVLVRPDSESKLVEAFKFLLENPKIAGKMGKEARRRVEQTYNYEALSKIAFKAFEKAVKDFS